MVGSNEERGERLARAIVVAISGETSKMNELFTRDVLASGPALQATSREELALEVERRIGAFSDRKVAVAALDVAGDQACVEWVASGVHSGPLELERIQSGVVEATGRRVRVRAVTVAEFDGDQICSFRSYWDDAALLEDLGVLTKS